MISTIARHELIGAQVAVVDAKAKSLVGLAGTIVDETAHQFLVETKNGRKHVQKNGCVFRFTTDHTEEIKGRDIEVAPEERIRLKVKHER